VLLAIAAWTNRDAINPDAVAYMRIATYYAENRIDLAISGYWGPLLSWLMLVPIALGLQPLKAARVAMACSAVVFLLGAMRLYRVMLSSSRDAGVASLLTALFTVYWSVCVITPDLLMGGLLLGAISLTVGSDLRSHAWHARAGLCYGLAFLAKSVALPVAVALTAVVLLLRARDAPGLRRHATLAAGCTFLALALVALPWIGLLSEHYGRPTFSTSGPVSHALVGPGEAARHHPYIRTFHVPPPGRVTAWEDPDTKLYRYWSPFESRDALRHQARLIWQNFLHITTVLKSFDAVGLGLAAVVLGFCFGAGVLHTQPWRYGLVLVAVSAGVYLPVFAVDTRYFLVCYPLMLACAFGLLAHLIERRDMPLQSAAQSRRLSANTVATSLVCASFLIVAVPDLKRALQGSYNSGYRMAQGLPGVTTGLPEAGLASIGPEGSIAFQTALYGAFILNRPYYGNRLDEAAIEHLPRDTRLLLAVVGATKEDMRVAQSSFVRRLGSFSDGNTGEAVTLYLVHPH
jgi:hypothetical protein